MVNGILVCSILLTVMVSALKDWELGKKMVLDQLNLIYNRYEMGNFAGTFFPTISNLNSQTWDILKYKLAKKLVSHDPSYFMLFSGSSVTAGHDNMFNLSFPIIVEKRMKPIFAALGVDLMVSNIAQGNNPCIPYSYCYEAMGGLDPDFLGWEQSYNCGKDLGVFELTARIASHSKNRALVYYSASGQWSPANCAKSEYIPPYSSEDWHPDSVADSVHFYPNQSDLRTQKEMLDSFFRKGPAVKSFYAFSEFYPEGKFAAIGPMGFNVWQRNGNCGYFNSTNGPNLSPSCTGADLAKPCGRLRFMSHEAGMYAIASNLVTYRTC